MHHHKSRAIRSVMIVLVGITIYIASFWSSGTQYTSIPHVQRVGYVGGGVNADDRYYVLTIQNESEVPWLIVAQRISQQSDVVPFTTEMNSTTDVVTVNEMAYNEIEGQTIVVLSTHDGKLMHTIARDQSPTLAMLGSNRADLRVIDFAELLPKPRSGEP